jgi:hypothetical protein
LGKEFGFIKKSGVHKDLSRIDILSVNYDQSANKTNVCIRIISEHDLENVVIRGAISKYDRKYSERVNVSEPIDKNIQLLQNIPKEINITFDGRYGYDFDMFDITIGKTGSGFIETFGFVTGAIIFVDWAVGKLKTAENQVKIKRLPIKFHVPVGTFYEVQYEIDFEFHDSTLRANEYYIFEYCILLDGKVLLTKRFPETGWIENKDNWFYDHTTKHISSSIWFFPKTYYCKDEKKNFHEIKIMAFVWCDSTRYHKTGGLASGFRTFREKNWDTFIRVAKQHNSLGSDKTWDKKTMVVQVHNPFYVKIKDEKKIAEKHGDEVYLKFDVGMNYERMRETKEPGITPRHPNEANIVLSHFKSEDNWHWTPITDKNFNWQTPGQKCETFVFKGFHGCKRHPGKVANYNDNLDGKVSGSNAIRVATKDSKGKIIKVENIKKKWHTKLLLGPDGPNCLPYKYNAECHDKAACGNGILDPGEECDPGVTGEGECKVGPVLCPEGYECINCKCVKEVPDEPVTTPTPPPNQPPVNPALMPESSSQPAGSSIKWGASATDPDDDPLYYQFWLKGPATGESWQMKRDWSHDNTWTWHTSTADVGTTYICVWIRDGYHAPRGSKDLQEIVFVCIT